MTKKREKTTKPTLSRVRCNRCRGIRKDGSQCKRKASCLSGCMMYCFQHASRYDHSQPKSQRCKDITFTKRSFARPKPPRGFKRPVRKSKKRIYHLDRLIGPVSLTEHRQRNGGKKIIYAFGDTHVRDMKCVGSKSAGEYPGSQWIPGFIIDQIEENPNKLIDLYLEESFPGKKGRYKGISNFLEHINYAFSDCTVLEKEKCPYKNLRVHYVDVRKTEQFPEMNYINSVYWSLYYLIIIRHRQIGEAVKESEFNEAIDQFRRHSKFVEKKQHQFNKDFLSDFDKIFQKTKIRKQLDAVKDPIVRSIIEYFFKRKIQEESIDPDLFEEIVEKIKKYRLAFKTGLTTPPVVSDYINFDNRRIIRLYYSTLLFPSLLVDTYTLGRIFRSFSIERRGISKEDPKNIIFYMGNDHANHIREFLDHLSNTYPHRGFDLKFQAESITKTKDFQCLDISGLQLPLFS